MGGSFGVPQDILNEIEKSKKKGRGEKEDVKEDPKESPKKTEFFDSESIPESGGEKFNPKVEEKEPEEEKGPTEEEQIKAAEKFLGVEISDDDLWPMFMGGHVEKAEIVIIPGKLSATFKTLSLNKNKKISSFMAKTIEEQYLEDGYRNIQTQHLLAAGLIALGKPGKVKELTDDYEEKFNQIGEMDTLLVGGLAEKWNSFNILVGTLFRREMDSGK